MDDIFIKTFSEEKYANDLLYNGSLFFRSAIQFAQMEGDSRQDVSEGKETFMLNTKFINEKGAPTIRIHHPNQALQAALGGKLQCLSGFVQNEYPKDVKNHKKIVFDKVNNCLIYSITYLQRECDYANLDINKFGEHMIIIYDTVEFKNRVCRYLAENTIDYCSGQVEYYSEKSRNLHTLFRKQERYKGEYEYRFIIFNNNETALYQIGDISDIAYYVRSDSVFKHIGEIFKIDR